jgi:hypothetical protein
VLTVKSDLDPHMIIELEDVFKLCSLVVLAIFILCILPLCLMWVGINLYFLSNQVLIKFDQLKCLMLIVQSTIKPLHSCLSPHLLSTTSAHPCYKQCCSERGCYEVAVKMLLVLGVRNPQSTACEVGCFCFLD